jgi:hypothetical protein
VGTLERQSQVHAANATANDNAVSFLQATVDHLMSKNDSVSYGMHVAGLGALMDQLADTNAKVHANANVAAELATSTQFDYQSLQDNLSAVLKAEHTRISTNVGAIQELEGATNANRDAIVVMNASLTSVDAAVEAVEEKQTTLGDDVNHHHNGINILNGTVRGLQTTIAGLADTDADPTIKQQVQMISNAMKEYGLYTQCDVGTFSNFGECSHDCDGGTMERTRSAKPLVGYEDVKGACPATKETIPCNMQACPSDCKVGSFGNWTVCSSQCGPGTQVRTRQLLNGAVGGGSCPKLVEIRACEINSDEDQEKCADAVLEILNGTWSHNSSSTKDYKVCSGGEVDSVEKLTPYKGCELIAGNLKFFVPIDFEFGDTFDDLLAVSGDVSFYNTGLKQLRNDDFPRLEAIGGTLLIAHNTELEQCTGFHVLHAVRGLVNVNNNNKLTKFELLEVQHVEGNLEFKTNAELETVSLTQLNAVNGAVDFVQNTQLRDVIFAALHSVDGKFAMDSNKNLATVVALELRRIGADLYMYNNQKLDVITMPLLALCGPIIIKFVRELDSLSFPRLSQIRGRLYFDQIDSMEYLSMPALTVIEGYFRLEDEYSIVSISMPKLLEIEGYVQIGACAHLKSISMPRLTQTNGYFHISFNDELGSLSDFGSLSTIQGSMFITNNPQLQCIKGFSNVTEISGQLQIYGNTKLFMCSELYATLRAAAQNNVASQNTYVKRDDCEHVCNNAEIRQDCVVGDFGNWSTCSEVCGPVSQYRTQAILKPATNGGSCDKKTESQDCEKSRVNTACNDTVSKIMAGTWKEEDGSDQNVCDGGEIDEASQLAKYDGCEIISGNLKFFLADDVDFASVQPFSSLLAVSGDVVFFGTALTYLGSSIFSNLQVVGGKFLVGHNSHLLSIKAFRSLHTVGGDYKIDQNEKLFTCEMGAVVTVGGAFQALNNKKLSAVTMPLLETVGGELQFYLNIEMKTAIYLSLKSIGGRFYFRYNEQIVTVQMPSLTAVQSQFEFSSNFQVKSASFKQLTTVNEGRLSINDNYLLQTLDMSALRTVNGIHFLANHAMRDVVFPSLVHVNGQFLFERNTQMLLLSCPKLAKVDGDFQVTSNSRLKEISMPALAQISYSLDFQNNPELSAVREFGKLESVGSIFRIQNNHKLQCIRGFENVTHIAAQLCIEQNSKLFMCDALADGLKEAAEDIVCQSFSYVPRDNCDHVCE